MTQDQQKRLARMRVEVEKWKAMNPEAHSWDTCFLLGIIDSLIAELRGKKSERIQNAE